MVISKPTEIKEFGFSPQQMDTRALRRVPEERVSAVLGIPAIVLGFGVGLEHATYANYRTALRAAWDNCVLPTQKQIAAVLEHQLLPEFEQNTESFDVAFDNSEVDALKENVNDQVAREIAMYVNGIKKLSEVRTEFDLDVTPEDEVYYVTPGIPAPPPPDQGPVPSGMAPDTRATMRGPKLTLPAPTVEKSDEAAALAWWRMQVNPWCAPPTVEKSLQPENFDDAREWWRAMVNDPDLAELIDATETAA
jgi:hypothetical protein